MMQDYVELQAKVTVNGMEQQFEGESVNTIKK